MTEEQKIVDFVFRDNSTRKFLCNDLFQEIKIPKEKCIAYENIKGEVRMKNYNEVLKIIEEFIDKNDIYKKTLSILYGEIDRYVIREIVTAYVYYLSKTNEEFKYIDIFTDHRSIAYLGVSPGKL